MIITSRQLSSNWVAWFGISEALMRQHQVHGSKVHLKIRSGQDCRFISIKWHEQTTWVCWWWPGSFVAALILTFVPYWFNRQNLNFNSSFRWICPELRVFPYNYATPCLQVSLTSHYQERVLLSNINLHQKLAPFASKRNLLHFLSGGCKSHFNLIYRHNFPHQWWLTSLWLLSLQSVIAKHVRFFLKQTLFHEAVHINLLNLLKNLYPFTFILIEILDWMYIQGYGAAK